MQVEFADKARTIAEFFEKQFAEVFGESDGQLARELERRFGDGSSVSVQNRVREAVAETLTRSREELVRQFSAADDRNPLADFKSAAVRSIEEAAKRSDATQLALLQKLGAVEKELQALRDEKEKLEELEAERERGTAKGRSFEEAVFGAVDALALAQGDVAEAVGDVTEATGKVGDIVVALDACNGPARGRVVVEAKDRKLSKPGALERARPRDGRALGRLRRARGAHRGGAAVEARAAARVQRRQARGGARSRAGHARARARLPPGPRPRADEALGRRRHRRRRAARHHRARAWRRSTDERKIKMQLTGAKRGISTAYELVEAMAERVRGHLQEIDVLVRPPEAEPATAPEDDEDQLAL